MPEQSNQINRCKVTRAKLTPNCSHQQPGDTSHSHQYVNTVETSHHEVKAEEDILVGLALGIAKKLTR